jgi:hypothetical protein
VRRNQISFDRPAAELALAHHHGTVQLTDEAIDAPVITLGEALDAAGIVRTRFRTLRPGEAWEIPERRDHLSGT